MKVKVKYIKSEYTLGTQNGIDYTVYPVEECDCEPDFVCYVHAGHFTEQH